jgi:hypothetical protein
MTEEQHLKAARRYINKIVINVVGRSCDFRYSVLTKWVMTPRGTALGTTAVN